VEPRLDAAAATGAARLGPAGAALLGLEEARVTPTAAPAASRIANTPITIVERLIFKVPLSRSNPRCVFAGRNPVVQTVNHFDLLADPSASGGLIFRG
jgi:hypothetical protein